MEKQTYEEIVKPLLVDDTLPVIKWMQQIKLIPIQRQCHECKGYLHWTQHNGTNDGYRWVCSEKECTRYKQTVSIRKDTIFFNSKINLQKWVQLIYCWCFEFSEAATVNLTNISRRSIQDIFASFRMACSQYFKDFPVQLGGPGVVVQIDESCFSHKVKFHRGRGPSEPLWVFGIVDTSVSPAIGYMEIVPKRDAATLLPIIERIVRPGSIIHSDEWRAYSKLSSNANYVYRTVNHSKHFVDPVSGVHTQTVESYWGKHKYRIKKMKGCRKDLLQGYLDQFMWLERQRGNKFLSFCEELQYRQ